MGLYYKSIFRNAKTSIILSNSNALIDENDIKRGFIDKFELVNVYGHLIIMNDIDDVSYVEDYELCTLDEKMKETLLKTLRVF